MAQRDEAFSPIRSNSDANVRKMSGEHVTITGEVVDLWCYLEGGDRGPAKKACAAACVKAGNPSVSLIAKDRST